MIGMPEILVLLALAVVVFLPLAGAGALVWAIRRNRKNEAKNN